MEMMDEIINLKTYPCRLAAKAICVNLQLDIEPVPKARPRFNGISHRVYTPEGTQSYEEFLGWQFKMAAGALPDKESLFGVRMLFERRNRHRADVDNMMKAVLDAATGIIWVDDSQVREVFAKLITDMPDKVAIVIYRLIDNAGISICKHCGKRFRRSPSQRGQGYCSTRCASEARRQTMVCLECGKEFTLPLSLAKLRKGFCSYSCRNKWWWKHSPKAPARQTKCIDCGKPLSRREYTRCRHCAIQFRRANSKGHSKLIQDFVKPI